MVITRRFVICAIVGAAIAAGIGAGALRAQTARTQIFELRTYTAAEGKLQTLSDRFREGGNVLRSIEALAHEAGGRAKDGRPSGLPTGFRRPAHGRTLAQRAGLTVRESAPYSCTLMSGSAV